MTAGLPDFFKHNLWANLRLLDACEQLSDAQLDATTKGVYGSVRETLRHLFSSEEGYAWRLILQEQIPFLQWRKAILFRASMNCGGEQSGREKNSLLWRSRQTWIRFSTLTEEPMMLRSSSC